MNEDLLKYNGWVMYIVLFALSGSLIFAINYLFLTDGLYYQSFGEQLAIDRIEKIMKMSKKWQWLGYALFSLIILVKISYTTLFLYIGVFFTELKIEFGKLFKAALLAVLLINNSN